MSRLSPLIAVLLAGAVTQGWAQSVPTGNQSAKPAGAVKRNVPAIATFGPPSGNPPPHPGRAIRERFTKADTDHNGKVSMKEAEAMMPKVFKDFASIDTKKTGEVTVEQVIEYFQMKRESQQHSGNAGAGTPAAPAGAASDSPATSSKP